MRYSSDLKDRVSIRITESRENLEAFCCAHYKKEVIPIATYIYEVLYDNDIIGVFTFDDSQSNIFIDTYSAPNKNIPPNIIYFVFDYIKLHILEKYVTIHAAIEKKNISFARLVSRLGFRKSFEFEGVLVMRYTNG